MELCRITNIITSALLLLLLSPSLLLLVSEAAPVTGAARRSSSGGGGGGGSPPEQPLPPAAREGRGWERPSLDDAMVEVIHVRCAPGYTELGRLCVKLWNPSDVIKPPLTLFV